MAFSRDARELLSAFSAAGIDCLVVGAHALGAHGYPRAVAPWRIDILAEISGVTFEEAWPSRLVFAVDGLLGRYGW